ncbi:MAG: hypothetical protein KTR13_09765 [Saprospiraceae bacterium]|nr:hypothetical protein [Saprospiraceae bacterium]
MDQNQQIITRVLKNHLISFLVYAGLTFVGMLFFGNQAFVLLGILFLLHVVFCLLMAVVSLIRKKPIEALADLLSALVILLIGFSTCYGIGSIL